MSENIELDTEFFMAERAVQESFMHLGMLRLSGGTNTKLIVAAVYNLGNAVDSLYSAAMAYEDANLVDVASLPTE